MIAPALPTKRAARTLSDEEQQVLHLLATNTYDQVREQTGWSRGRIWSLAAEMGALKTQSRIEERRAARLQRQQEYLQEILNTTVRADVLDFLDGLPDGCAQLVLTSPPYNLGKSYGGSKGGDCMSPLRFLGWMMMVIAECERILQEGGVLAFNMAQTRDRSGALIPMDVLLFDAFREAGLTYHTRVVWTFEHGLTPSTRPSERYETVLIFSKGPQPVFNPGAARTPQKQPGKRHFKGPNIGQLSGSPLGAWPSNVWRINHVGHNHPEKTGHPAQMPLALVLRAIGLYSVPNQLVVDPFSGSGSVHEGTVRTGRAFTGADLYYEEIRADRLAKAKPDLVTHLPGVTDESAAIWQYEARRVDAAAGRRTAAEEQAFLGDVFAPC